jgi:hypothetical protein
MSRLLALLMIVVPLSVSAAEPEDCASWSSTACWAHALQDAIDAMKDIPDATKQVTDQALAGVYQAGQGLGEAAGKAGVALGQAYGKLVASHDRVCADDDLFLVESIGVIAAGIFAVEVSMTGGATGGTGAVALKGLLISQSPKLISKLHERLCGSPFAKVDPGFITQVETAIDKALAGK